MAHRCRHLPRPHDIRRTRTRPPHRYQQHRRRPPEQPTRRVPYPERLKRVHIPLCAPHPSRKPWSAHVFAPAQHACLTARQRYGLVIARTCATPCTSSRTHTEHKACLRPPSPAKTDATRMSCAASNLNPVLPPPPQGASSHVSVKPWCCAPVPWFRASPAFEKKILGG